MLFRRELTEPLDSLGNEHTFARAVAEVVGSLDLRDSDWEAISGYNLYSDLAPPDEALRLIRTLATFIKNQDRFPAENAADPAESTRVIRPPKGTTRQKTKSVSQGVVVIGAGDYARTQIIPALQRAGLALNSVVDLEPYLADYTRRRFGFKQAYTDWQQAISQSEASLVVVASYHDSHAKIAAAALNAGKKVFLEKPPAVTREDLRLLLEAANGSDRFLEIGYNRRFAPFTQKAKQLLDEVSGPTSITCLVKEVDIPDQHWYRWPKEWTRISGNLCHWIDLSVYLLGADCDPVEMIVTGPHLSHQDDEKGLNVIFRDGSSLSIVASSRGDSTLGVQELIEIRRGCLTIELDDYRRLFATAGGKVLCRVRTLRNKGHAAMYKETLTRIRKNLPALYTSRELELSTRMTINATEMIRKGQRSRTLSGNE
ncbi:MAG TPA: Gfo/Idh/MocA family oxidoreductase [Pyrinomonadaceae bacterium]|nr:Gfo/Idh/MocA family oxidoreductase [Pyrinomonadaceae bacterium]